MIEYNGPIFEIKVATATLKIVFIFTLYSFLSKILISFIVNIVFILNILKENC